MPEELLEAVARRFRVLGVPSRLRILDALMGGAMSMTELARVTGLEQSNLSRQITELERADCVTRTRLGRAVNVEICDPSLAELCALVCDSLREEAERSHRSLRGRTSNRR